MAQLRPPTQSEPRWHVAWTHPAGEFRAELDLMDKGFDTYLPLHLEGWTSRPSEASVVPVQSGPLGRTAHQSGPRRLGRPAFIRRQRRAWCGSRKQRIPERRTTQQSNY